MTTNNITGDKLTTGVVSDQYRNNYDFIFRKTLPTENIAQIDKIASPHRGHTRSFQNVDEFAFFKSEKKDTHLEELKPYSEMQASKERADMIKEELIFRSKEKQAGITKTTRSTHSSFLHLSDSDLLALASGLTDSVEELSIARKEAFDELAKIPYKPDPEISAMLDKDEPLKHTEDIFHEEPIQVDSSDDLPKGPVVYGINSGHYGNRH